MLLPVLAGSIFGVPDKNLERFGLSPFFDGLCLAARHDVSMDDSFLAKRTSILRQMAALDSMELGSLKAEFRSSPSGAQSGPYFKHQVWIDGANFSQRVSQDDAPTLQAAIDNRLHFEALAQAFIDLTVDHSRQNRFPDALKRKTSRTSLPRKPRSRT